MNRSEAIRRLLAAEPDLAPAALRDRLHNEGVSVDVHLIREVRKAWRRVQAEDEEYKPLHEALLREPKELVVERLQAEGLEGSYNQVHSWWNMLRRCPRTKKEAKQRLRRWITEAKKAQARREARRRGEE